MSDYFTYQTNKHATANSYDIIEHESPDSQDRFWDAWNKASSGDDALVTYIRKHLPRLSS